MAVSFPTTLSTTVASNTTAGSCPCAAVCQIPPCCLRKGPHPEPLKHRLPHSALTFPFHILHGAQWHVFKPYSALIPWQQLLKRTMGFVSITITVTVIKPYAMDGMHDVTNGILPRSYIDNEYTK